jgi:hypothetical protein
MKYGGRPIWTKLKTKVEAFFSKETKGKVQLHHAVYRPRKTGRAWIEIDKCEIVSMTVMYDYMYSPERYYGSEFGMGFFLKSMREYLDLSFASVLGSGNPLIKAVGMLDKRLGKRRLMCMDISDSAPIVKYFYLIRCESCGVKPTIYESKKDLLDIILTNGRCLETSTDKENQRKEKNAAVDLAEQVLANPTKQNLHATILRIYSGNVTKDDLRLETAQAIYSSFEAKNTDADKLVRYYLHVEAKSNLLEMVSCVNSVVNMAEKIQEWLRPIEAWKPRSYNPRKQLSSLARHLWANYDVPLFMDWAWTDGGEQERDWFRHIGIGKNIRTADNLPVKLTKQEAHHFLEAPATYSIHSAFRWAQVRALGGNKALADALRGTRLVREFRDDDFWQTVIRFFVSHPSLDLVHIGPIIDYIWNQKFVPVYVATGPESVEERPPPQSNFSMRGRNMESLIKAVNDWHCRLANEKLAGQLNWRKSDIEDFTLMEDHVEESRKRCWTIRELTDSDQLVLEGRAMGHCVATYAGSCHAGQCSIWTMQVETQTSVDKCLTIEIRHPEKEIFQVRGKHNRWPVKEELEVVKAWACNSKIKIADYMR